MVISETFPNPHIVEYHVRKRLTEGSILSYCGKDWLAMERADNNLLSQLRRRLLGIGTFSYERHKHREHMKNAALVDDLFSLEGIVEVTLHPYRIRVAKGQAFAWNEIDTAILQILQKYGMED